MNYIVKLEQDLPSMVPMTLIIVSIVFIAILMFSTIKKVEINILGMGVILIVQLVVFTIIFIWTLLLNALVLLSIIMFLISLIYVTIDFSVIHTQKILLILFMSSQALNYFMFKQFKLISEQFVKNQDIITNKYISFLVKVMTALTLLLTGLYSMIYNRSNWGFLISVFSFVTVALSFIEIYRVIKKVNGNSQRNIALLTLRNVLCCSEE